MRRDDCSLQTRQSCQLEKSEGLADEVNQTAN